MPVMCSRAALICARCGSPWMWKSICSISASRPTLVRAEHSAYVTLLMRRSTFWKRSSTCSRTSCSGPSDGSRFVPSMSHLLPTTITATGHEMLSDASNCSRSKIRSTTANAALNESLLDTSATTTKPIRLRSAAIGFLSLPRFLPPTLSWKRAEPAEAKSVNFCFHLSPRDTVCLPLGIPLGSSGSASLLAAAVPLCLVSLSRLYFSNQSSGLSSTLSWCSASGVSSPVDGSMPVMPGMSSSSTRMSWPWASSWYRQKSCCGSIVGRYGCDSKVCATSRRTMHDLPTRRGPIRQIL